MSYYPIFLELEDKTALVVGGGKVAERKIETLLAHGASIHIVSRELTDTLKKLVDGCEIRHMGEEFREEYLEGALLVIAATDDHVVNRRVSECARERGLLVNVVDQPADCNFIVPSMVRRGDLLIAISTSGKSPALAKRIRKELERQFGREYGIFLLLMGRLRIEILSKGYSQTENSRIFHEVVDSDILDTLARDDWKGVESTLRKILPRDLEITEVLKDIVES